MNKTEITTGSKMTKFAVGGGRRLSLLFVANSNTID
jgi:hypothetical protein